MVKLAEPRPGGAVEVCGVDELWDGEMACFRVGDTTILLVKLNGRFHAYQGQCPHQSVALVEGELDGGVLTCRAHRWQFDAASGQGVNPRSAHLERFPVHVVEQKVSIEVCAANDEPNVVLNPNQLTQGPHDAE
jgi:nitrite reductase/ring-hydroxylating ferredoxin subunit